MINNTDIEIDKADKWKIIAEIKSMKMKCILWRFSKLNLILNVVIEDNAVLRKVLCYRDPMLIFAWKLCYKLISAKLIYYLKEKNLV